MDPFSPIYARIEPFMMGGIIVLALLGLARIYACYRIASGAWPTMRLIRDNAAWLGTIAFFVIALIYMHFL